MIAASKLVEAFPEVKPGVVALGARVLVQLRTVRAKTVSGLILASDTKDFNKANTQLGKVIQLGNIAFKNRNTAEVWPEGAWAAVGDLVRVPKWGGDRFERTIPGTEDTAIFCIFSDHELIAKVDAEAFEELDEIL